jgi:hypothetical protein
MRKITDGIITEFKKKIDAVDASEAESNSV